MAKLWEKHAHAFAKTQPSFAAIDQAKKMVGTVSGSLALIKANKHRVHSIEDYKALTAPGVSSPTQDYLQSLASLQRTHFPEFQQGSPQGKDNARVATVVESVLPISYGRTVGEKVLLRGETFQVSKVEKVSGGVIKNFLQNFGMATNHEELTIENSKVSVVLVIDSRNSVLSEKIVEKTARAVLMPSISETLQSLEVIACSKVFL